MQRCRCLARSSFGIALEPPTQRLPVGLGLIRIKVSEAEDALVKPRARSHISRDRHGVAGAGVATRKQLAAEIGVAMQVGGRKGLQVERRLMIIQLTDKVVAIVDARIPEERIAGELHGALTVHNTMSLLDPPRSTFGDVACISGGGLLLDLDKEWVRVRGARVALEIDDVVAQAHRAGADDLEGNVDRSVLRQKMLSLRLQRLRVLAERGENLACVCPGNTLQQRRQRAEAARPAANVFGRRP